MSDWVVEVSTKSHLPDVEGEGISHDIADTGFETPVRVRVAHLYWLEGDLDASGVQLLATRLLTDAVSQEYRFSGDAAETGWAAEIHLKAGVTDAVGESVLKGARDLGIHGLRRVATGNKVYFLTPLTREDVARLCERLLVNDVVQTYQLRVLGGA